MSKPTLRRVIRKSVGYTGVQSDRAKFIKTLLVADQPSAASSFTKVKPAGIATATIGRNPGAERLYHRLFRVLDAWSFILPRRVADEDLGDYLEDIASRAAQGQRVWAWIRVGTAIVRTGVNAIGYVAEQFGRSKAI